MSIDGPPPACNADMCEHCARRAARLERERIGLKRMKRTAAKVRQPVLIWRSPR